MGLWVGKVTFSRNFATVEINYNLLMGRNIYLVWWYSEKNKGGLQNPPKRFCRFPKCSKCVKSLKKRIKIWTEPFEGSAFYPISEPSLTEPFFRFCTAKKGSVRKYETLKVQYKMSRVQYGILSVTKNG